MNKLLQGIAYVILFAGPLLGFWAFVEENAQPTLHAGTFHLVIVFSAALIVGPALGVSLGMHWRDWVRHELNQLIDKGYPASIQGLANLALRYTPVYYFVLAAGAAMPVGYGAFGTTKLIDHRYKAPIGEATCVVDAAFSDRSNRLKLRLKCRIAEGPAVIDLILPHTPAILPQEVTLPVYRGVLGSVFADGRSVSL